MKFTEKNIEKYIDKKRKLEMQLQDEMAFGEPSKTTLRKIEELERIINYDEWHNAAEELAKKIKYYEELLKRHNISYLK